MDLAHACMILAAHETHLPLTATKLCDYAQRRRVSAYPRAGEAKPWIGRNQEQNALGTAADFLGRAAREHGWKLMQLAAGVEVDVPPSALSLEDLEEAERTVRAAPLVD